MIFLLVIIAVVKLLPRICDRELTVDVLLCIASLLRCPTDGTFLSSHFILFLPPKHQMKQGKVSQHQLFLSQLFCKISINYPFPLCFLYFFQLMAIQKDMRNVQLLLKILIYQTLFLILCAVGLTYFFEILDLTKALSCRVILKLRSKTFQASCYTPSTVMEMDTANVLFQSLLSSTTLSTETPASLFTINKGFDFNLKENSSTSRQYNPKIKKDFYRYTQSQRKFVELAAT